MQPWPGPYLGVCRDLMAWGWKQAIGMQALATVPGNIFSGDTFIAVCHYETTSQAATVGNIWHGWGEEGVGEVPCGAHSARMAAVVTAGFTQFGPSLSAFAPPSLRSLGPQPWSPLQAGPVVGWHDGCDEPPRCGSCVACLGLGYVAHWRHGLRRWEV